MSLKECSCFFGLRLTCLSVYLETQIFLIVQPPQKYLLALDNLEVWITNNSSTPKILSKLPDKATRDDGEKARENTIRLNRGLWLDETIFSRMRNSFRLSDWSKKIRNAFSRSKIWCENLSMYEIKFFIAKCFCCFINMQTKKICIRVWNHFKHGFSNTAVFSTRFSLGF